ncbi:hypothetical protein SAY86_003139 [Trapa natans]|uniref:Non-haem dioxygenase N-terminal domain-containing protein n=1 Tax=Trapa natans TaxID=22666 RepID=A0AAN7LJC2_TRANT|nr:hypothetical protein SAY86_003139 [Trapa natans]
MLSDKMEDQSCNGAFEVTKVSNLNFIDISADVQQSVTLLKQACLDFGFFYVINHGICQEFLDVVFDQSRRYFTLPLREKDETFEEREASMVPQLFDLDGELTAEIPGPGVRTDVFDSGSEEGSGGGADVDRIDKPVDDAVTAHNADDELTTGGGKGSSLMKSGWGPKDKLGELQLVLCFMQTIFCYLVVGDYKEGYYIGVEVPEGDPEANKSFYGPNIGSSTDILPGWRDTMEKDVVKSVARIIALVLDLDINFFDKPEMLGKPIATVCLLRYGGCQKVIPPILQKECLDQEHTDYGLITLLATDNVLVLQIYKDKDAKPKVSEYVPPIKGELGYDKILAAYASYGF